MPFYAVGHGFKRGVYESWDEVKKQIDGFPEPVHKKFDTHEEAEKFVDARKATKIQLPHPEDEGSTFYAVARGHTVGVFTSYDVVKASIEDYPVPRYKKFDNLAAAIAFYEKYANGKKEDENGDLEETAEKKVDKKEKPTSSKAKDEAKASSYYAVARGHKAGVYMTWAECQEQTKGFKGAKFKKFDNMEEAQLFADGKTLKQIEETMAKKRPASDGDEEKDEEASPPKKAKN